MGRYDDWSERVRESMQKAKEKGRYTARPIRFIFLEDAEHYHPESIYLKRDKEHKTYTLTMSETRLYEYARRGYSMNRIAKIVGISPSTLYYTMRLNDGSNSRFRGVKDRYTPYMELYRKAKGMSG